LFTDAALIASGQSPTLTWHSTGAACTAGGGWSGSKSASGSEMVGPLQQTTTFTLSCAAANALSGGAAVTVVTSNPLPPVPTANKVWSEQSVTSLDYVRIPYAIRAMVWNAARGLFYGVTTADSPTAPNSVVAINPVTLATQVLPLDGEASVIDITRDNEFVYVGMLHGGGVRRVRTSDLTQDLAVSLGPEATVQRVVPSPVAPHTFAVVTNGMSGLTDVRGLYIYDDATPRPSSVVGDLQISPTESYFGVSFIDADWNDDGTLIYGMSFGQTNGLFYLDVDAQGAHFQKHRGWPTSSSGSIVDNRYFGDDGRVFNLTGPVNQYARIPDDYFASGASRLPAPERGKIFSMGTNLRGGAENGTRIMAFDFDQYTYLDAIVFNGAADFRGQALATWGTDGIFIAGQTESIVAHGTFAAAGGVPPASSTTLPVMAAGIDTNTATGLVSYRIADMGARAVTANPCGKLFVTTDLVSSVRPGSVLEVNPDNLTVMRSANVGNEPVLMAAADDCNSLYVGSGYRSSVSRVRTSDLATTDELPLGGDEVSRARSMSVAPGQAQTVAIAMGNIDFTSLCSDQDRGVMIFDGNTPRPVYGTAGNLSIKSVAFGANPGVLYGEDFNNVYGFSVDTNGLGNPQPIMANSPQATNYDLGRDLYFDPMSKHLYNLFGNVFDATLNVELPKIKLLSTPVTGNCFAPAESRVADAATGKLFWVGEGDTPGMLAIAAYTPDGSTNLFWIQFGVPNEMGDLGTSAFLSRLPNNRLAFVTSRGFLIILDGASLAP
jgi:hypothetical protein